MMINQIENSVHDATWNFKDVFIIFLIYFLSLMFIGMILSPLRRIQISEYFLGNFLRVYTSLGLGTILLVWLKTVKKQRLSLIGVTRCEFKYYLYAIVCGIAIYFLSKLLFEFDAVLYTKLKETGGLVWLFASAVLFAPISEELYYRGILFSACRKKFRLAGGVILSALVFSLVHFSSHNIDIWHTLIIYNFVGGVFFASLYYYSKSIFPSILSHSIVGLIVHLEYIV